MNSRLKNFFEKLIVLTGIILIVTVGITSIMVLIEYLIKHSILG